ncbi:YfhO family protein [Paenibacillus barengoltzii]
MIVCLFFYKIFIGQIYSPTNLLYAMPPWSSENSSVVSSGALISDPIDSFLPSVQVFKDSIMHGKLALWTSDHSMGVSTVVETISFLFSPNTLIYLVFPLEYASNIDLMLRVYISLVGMFLFLYKLKMNVNAARLGAIIFSFSLPMVVWLNWPHIWVSCLAPWLFLSVQNIYESNRKWIPIASYIIACMINGNMPAYAAYYLYAAGAYYVYLIIRKSVKTKSYRFFFSKSIEFSVSVVLGIGMAFAYIFNFLKYMNGIGFIEQREGSFHSFDSMKYLIALFDPKYFSSLELPTIHINEYSSYFGVITLFIFFFSFVYCYKRHFREHLFWAISALVVGLVIFGSPLTELFSHLPGIGTSLATRLVGLMAFLVAVTSAYIFSYLFDKSENNLMFTSILFSVMVVGILLFTGMRSLDEFKINSTLLISVFILLCAVILLTVSALNIKIKKAVMSLLVILLVADVFRAGMNYNPTVDRNSASLNPETEITNFLSENLGNQRFVALGTWNVFPNTSVFYNIMDLRGHGFFLRENRIKNYLLAIDSESYITDTRTGFNNITNYNLLNTASVKYIVSENGIGEEMPQALLDVQKFVPIGKILPDTLIEQSFISKKSNLASVSIQFATYGRSFKSEKGNIQFQLLDKDNKVIREENIRLSDLNDNEFYSVSFEPVNDSLNSQYKFRIFTNDTNTDNAPTIWSSSTKAYEEGSYYLNGIERDSTLMFKLGFFPEGLIKNTEKVSGELVYENLNALPRAYLINKVQYIENSEEILLQMSEGGALEKAYVEEPLEDEIFSTDQDSKITAVENLVDQGDKITMEVNVEEPQFLVLSDNYLEGWSAFIDGKEAKLYRANYLFKGIEVPAGKHNVTFKYEPRYFKTSIMVSVLFYLLGISYFIALALSKKRKRSSMNEV